MTTYPGPISVETKNWLEQHPIVQAMAEELRDVPREKICNCWGSPLSDFAAAAKKEFKRRGGSFDPIHAEAIIHADAIAWSIIWMLGLDKPQK